MRARENQYQSANMSPTRPHIQGLESPFVHQHTPGQAAILHLQRTQGNAAAVQRYGNKKGEAQEGAEPTPENYVGGNPELTANVNRLGGKDGETVAAGQAGYTNSLLATVDQYSEDFRAAPTLASTSFDATAMDGIIAGLRDDNASLTDEVDDFTMTSGYANTFKKKQQQWAVDNSKFLNGDKTDQEGLTARYNIWVPQANQYFNAHTRLEAMKYYLGVDDVAAMPSALFQGLDDATKLGVSKLGTGNSDVYGLTGGETVKSKVGDAKSAGQELMSSWRTWKSKVDLEEEKEATRESAKPLTERMKEISELKERISSATTIMDGLIAFRVDSEAFEAKEDVSVMDGAEHVNKQIKNFGGGFEIPTSITSGVQLGMDLYYKEELEKLSAKIGEINSYIDALGWTSVRLDKENANETVIGKVEEFSRKIGEIEDALAKRRRNYVQLGDKLDQLDETGGKPGGKNKKERYAQLMLVVSQVREMIVLGEQAIKAASEGETNITPARISKFYSDMSRRRNNLRLEFRPTRDISLTASENELRNTIYTNVEAFMAHVAEQSTLFKRVDNKAAEMIATFTGGSGDY
jgi:hypothetical protein